MITHPTGLPLGATSKPRTFFQRSEPYKITEKPWLPTQRSELYKITEKPRLPTHFKTNLDVSNSQTTQHSTNETSAYKGPRAATFGDAAPSFPPGPVTPPQDNYPGRRPQAPACFKYDTPIYIHWVLPFDSWAKSLLLYPNRSETAEAVAFIVAPASLCKRRRMCRHPNCAWCILNPERYLILSTAVGEFHLPKVNDTIPWCCRTWSFLFSSSAADQVVVSTDAIRATLVKRDRPSTCASLGWPRSPPCPSKNHLDDNVQKNMKYRSGTTWKWTIDIPVRNTLKLLIYRCTLVDNLTNTLIHLYV